MSGKEDKFDNQILSETETEVIIEEMSARGIWLKS